MPTLSCFRTFLGSIFNSGSIVQHIQIAIIASLGSSLAWTLSYRHDLVTVMAHSYDHELANPSLIPFCESPTSSLELEGYLSAINHAAPPIKI